MRALAKALLDLAYPSRCALCSLLGDKAVCEECHSEMELASAQVTPGMECVQFTALIYDYSGRAAQAVQHLKYGRGTSVADWMAEELAKFADDHALLGCDLIVPVPIHWSRRCYRGFNQAELLTERLPKELVRSDLLKRTRATRPQVGLTREERLSNLKGAFAASEAVNKQRILLVDDVCTTGQTVRECGRALRDAGALSVGVLAFAGGI